MGSQPHPACIRTGRVRHRSGAGQVEDRATDPHRLLRCLGAQTAMLVMVRLAHAQIVAALAGDAARLYLGQEEFGGRGWCRG